jgi:hypothetical protein
MSGEWALRWLGRHPGVLDRVDRLIESSEGYESSGTMIVFILPPCYLMALAGLVSALIFGGRSWLVASAFGVVAVFFTVAAILYWFNDRHRKAEKQRPSVSERMNG